MAQAALAPEDSFWNYKVEVAATSNLSVTGTTRGHTLHTGQPERWGGDDLAVTPPETFAFMVGTCVVSVARMIAKQDDLDVTNLRATVEGTIDAARTLGINKHDRAGFQGLTIAVSFDSPMPKKKQAFIKEVIDRCHICDNTANTTPFKVSLI